MGGSCYRTNYCFGFITWGLVEEMVALKEGVFSRKLVGSFVRCVLKNKGAASGISGCRTTSAVHGWVKKTRTNIADADSLFDTPCILLWQQHSFNRQSTNRLCVYSSDRLTCEQSSLKLHTAAVGTAWPLLGSARNGQAAIQQFKKHLQSNIADRDGV